MAAAWRVLSNRFVVCGLGLGVWGLVFRVWGLEFVVWGLGFKHGLKVRIEHRLEQQFRVDLHKMEPICPCLESAAGALLNYIWLLQTTNHKP